MMTKFLSEVDIQLNSTDLMNAVNSSLHYLNLENPYSWHTKYNILFIDNPVGTGFSFTDAGGYCQNITQVAQQLYSGMRQFFQLFPWLASNPFYITGESFAGKYIPAMGFEIYERNKVEDFQINLQVRLW